MRRNELEVSSTSATKRDEAHAAVTGHLDRHRRPWGSSRPRPGRSKLEDLRISAAGSGEARAATGHSNRSGRSLESSSLTSSRLTSSRALAPSSALQPISCRRGVPAVPRHAAGDPRQLGMRRNELEVSSTSATKRDEARAAVTGHLDRHRRPWGSSRPRPGRSKLEDLRISAAGSGEARAATGHSNQLCPEILPWLPDDLLVKILSRLPAKPVHRFKCVSKSWRDLISNPNHRKRLPQALAGFICGAAEDGYPMQFINASGRGPPLVDPALAFLPNHTSIVVWDCCNGLLLLGSGVGSDSLPRDYVVCNPATQKWVALPDSGVTANFRFSVLAFDPAVSSHFHVLGYLGNGTVCIYSSLTGGWRQSHTGLGSLAGINGHDMHMPDTVFLNGVLHFLVDHEFVVRAVNLETKEWRDIELPDCDHMSVAFLGQSQGCLVCTTIELDNGRKISVWTLEDYGSGGWILKHSLSATQLLRRYYPSAFVFHPELNMVFYDQCGQKRKRSVVIKSYDIDCRELRRVAAQIVTNPPGNLFLPYVPFFGDMPEVGQSSELNWPFS